MQNVEDSDEDEVSGSGKKSMVESGLQSDESESDESIIDESESSGESIKLATGAKPSYVDASGFRRR